MADVTFSIPLTAEGAVSEPSGIMPFDEPSAESDVYFDCAGVNVLEVPEFGWVLADGVNPLRFVVRDAVYDAGDVAPASAPTLAVAGAARATVVGTYTGQPSDGQILTLGVPGNSTTITFKSALVTNGTLGHQVQIGSDANETYGNLQELIQGTGTQGSDFFNVLTYLGYEDNWQTVYKIEVSDLDTGAGTITLRYVDYGTEGNSAVSTETASNFSFGGSTFSGGSTGTGTSPAAGTYRYFFTWYRAADGAETGRSPIAKITQATNTNITVSGLSDAADSTFDYIRIYRTTDTGVEFRLTGTAERGDSSFTDSTSDTDLAVAALWNPLNHRAYAEGKPPRGRALAYWKGAIWTIGAHLAAEYTRGTASVTNGSATVTMSVKGVTERMVGRTFQVDDTSETYTILSVSPSTPSITLGREYEGSTDGTAGFTIRDDYDASRLRRCVPFLYNQWPVDESPGRIETDDNEGGTALLATRSRLFAFSPTSIIALTGEDDQSWEISKVAEGVGCAAPGMVVGVEGGGVFLSYDGFYALSPDETITSISEPKSPRGAVARGLDRTLARIAWRNIDNGYSVYDPGDKIVVFGVPLDGASVPNYEIVFDLQNGLWALYKRAEWTDSSLATLPNGEQALVAGDREGNLWHVGIGESDGFFGTEAVQTLSGAQTKRVLTVSGTPFSTSGDGEAGKPVVVLYADGSTVAYGKVASNTTSALTLAEDLDTAPAASDQIVLGGIAWQARSGFTTFGEEYNKKTLRSVTVRHAPTTRGDYFLSFAVDDGDFRLCPVGTSIGDLSDTDGKVRHRPQWPGDSHAICLRGFKPGGQAVIRGGVFDLVIRETGRM